MSNSQNQPRQPNTAQPLQNKPVDSRNPNMQQRTNNQPSATGQLNRGSMIANQPLRQLNNSGASSPANRMSTNSPINTATSKAFPTSPAVANAAASVSPSSAFSPKLPEKAPVVSQAAVSQLVRKELEKSLAQIEFPKPPPQDIYFLPNTNSPEFLMCLGLEEVAKCVQEHLINKQLKADVKEQQANNADEADIKA